MRALDRDAGSNGSRPIGSPARIDLTAVEEALCRMQHELDRAEARPVAWRDPMDGRVASNLLAGYAFIDAAAAEGIDVFAMGNLRHLLELNAIVLCGTSPDRRGAYAAHTAATERKFYEERDGGIRAVVEWLASHAAESPWSRAAGVYAQILAKPQLYIEGNHRTGALVMSYILLRDGRPPFVLTPGNARGYFELSAALRDTPKAGPATLFRLPGIREKLAALLLEHSDPIFTTPAHQ